MERRFALPSSLAEPSLALDQRQAAQVVAVVARSGL
jgi:hypothetical protein